MSERPAAAPGDPPLVRRRETTRNLRRGWEKHAAEWIAWAREPEHDSYWRFHRDQFLELVPKPGRRTLDLGCGEGRLSRDLKRLGHQVVGVDVSPIMIAAAQQADPKIETHVADAAQLPFPEGSFDCVVAHLSLQDVDDLGGTVREVARVLEPEGRLCAAVVHPMNSASDPRGDTPDPPMIISTSYLDVSYYVDHISRNGLEMTFVSAHRPIEVYANAFTDAGLLIERLREPKVPETAITTPRAGYWRRFPLFLHIRALKPGGPDA
jgi:SAM-dependent methyltransferase